MWRFGSLTRGYSSHRYAKTTVGDTIAYGVLLILSFLLSAPL